MFKIKVRARVNISANSMDVSFRCLPDIIDAPSTQPLRLEPEAPSVAVQYMWAKVIPLIYALHLWLDSDYPGVFHQVKTIYKEGSKLNKSTILRIICTSGCNCIVVMMLI